MNDSDDTYYMRQALKLAMPGLGRTWPNPSVGAVIVKGGAIVGEGATARGGRPHAEVVALTQAGEKAKGATLYVTLEPCSHLGQTPPCAEAIIAAGIKRVAAACTDPNPKVSGKGFAMLKAAGIDVVQGICEQEARALNEGFFSVIERGRPFVTLKIATSSDGKIASAQGTRTPITGEESRRKVHELRASYDAILTGIGTVLADDPELNCRLPGRENDSPQRVVMDSHLRIPPEAKILPAWIVTSEEAMTKEAAKVKTLEAKGAALLTVSRAADGLSLKETLAALTEKGITRLMVEAGSALAGAFMREKLADRLYWFKAPMNLGNKALPALKAQDIFTLVNPQRLRRTERFGEDVLEVYDSPLISTP